MSAVGLLAGVVVLVATAGGSFFYGTKVGEDHVLASEKRINEAIDKTRETAQQGAAAEIAKLRPKNVYITRRLETEVREKPVFRDCRSGPDSVRIFNESIAAQPGADASGRGLVPSSGAAAR